MYIREEIQADISQVYAINTSAFKGKGEADLVDALRRKAAGVISLVACLDDEKVAGHIMLSPVTIESETPKQLYGLAPMAILPEHQHKGIGSSLVNAALTMCRQRHISAVFVLGHPEFYPRFGFIPASRYNITSEYEVPDEMFMVLELEPGSLHSLNGLVKYHPVFNTL